MARDEDVLRLKKLRRLGVTAADVRQWAKEVGFPVGERGRLSPDLIEAYVKAHPRRQVLPTVGPRRRKQPTKMRVIPERTCEWTLSRHAAKRMRELGFSRQEVMDAIERPDVTYEQSSYGSGEAIIQRGGLALGVNLDAKVVKTVLLRSVERWEHPVPYPQDA